MSTTDSLLAPPRPMPKRLLSLQPRPSPYASSKPQRPGSMKRAHSFCANTPNSTYALASTSTSYLTEDKKGLIAPKLERTLSSMGCDRNPGRLPLGEQRENMSIPTILVHPSTTPPRRPSINPNATPALSYTSRSSSFSPTTPTTPTIVTPITQSCEYVAPKKQGKEIKEVVERVTDLVV